MAYNVLIVDDSSVARMVIGKTMLLSNQNIGDIHYATNGKEALDIIKDNWIDIVFADINMPIMNGIELINEMSADSLMNSIPVIVVSTEGSSTRIEELKAKGIKGYIRKPFTPEEISEILKKTLGGGENEN